MRPTEVSVNAESGETEFRVTLDGALVKDNRTAVIATFRTDKGKPMLNIGGPGEVTVASAKEYLRSLRAAIYLAKTGVAVP